MGRDGRRPGKLRPTDSGCAARRGRSRVQRRSRPRSTRTRRPEDKKGWTVILLSTTSKDEATALALKARDKGVPAGILQSDTYKNLSSGLWMVWAGRFGSENEAYSAATTYSGKGFDGESVE